MNKHNKSFSIIERIKSFGYALNGLRLLITEEHNARIHFIASVTVIILSFYLNISTIEWLFVLISIGLVIVLEVINTVIENISDIISPEKNLAIKKIKDLSAAAALIGSLTALLVGGIILIPKIVALFLI